MSAGSGSSSSLASIRNLLKLNFLSPRSLSLTRAAEICGILSGREANSNELAVQIFMLL